MANSAPKFMPLIALLAAAGCGGEERTLDERLFGVWTASDHGNQYKLTFNSDGTFAADTERAVRAVQGEYWISGGDTLVFEGVDQAGQPARIAGMLFLTSTTVVPRAMTPIGSRVGFIGYWSTRDGALSYEFRGENLVIRRELLGDNKSQSLISKGAWQQASANKVEVTFPDPSVSGTLELFAGGVLGQPFHR